MNSELRRQIDGVKGQIDEQRNKMREMGNKIVEHREEIKERNGRLEGQQFQRSTVKDSSSQLHRVER